MIVLEEVINLLLGEMDVINSVEAYLLTKDYRITSKVKSVDEHGIDLVAVSPRTKVKLNVEAKGQTSSKSETNRFGKEFNRNQKRDHLGKALLKSCEYFNKHEAAAIALPDDTIDHELVNSIRGAIDRLGIVVFLVDYERAVRVVGNLPS
jgi:hypothetical protein